MTAIALPAATPPSGRLDRQTAALVFAAFAAAYFCSALVRAITATLSPVLTQDFNLHARDLGLLAGGYFFGFAAMQLPLGRWLDRHGPKRVILCFLTLAVLGCLATSVASSFAWLLASRVLVGMGVSACLMAPLTGFRRWLDSGALMRANSWMLMTGSLGMLASTLPVQWLIPLTGWRPMFWILAAAIVLCMAVIAWLVPGWSVAPTLGTDVSSLPPEGALRLRSGEAGSAAPAGVGLGAPTLPAAGGSLPPHGADLARGGPLLPSEAPARATALACAAASASVSASPPPRAEAPSYAEVWRSRYFQKMSPLAFFNYGGLVAVQTLWAGPWMVRVAGYTPLASATGLFCINAVMLVTFWSWGMANPALVRRGWSADRLLLWGVPLSLLVLAANIAGGSSTGWLGWALFCMCSSVLGLAQPAVGMAFGPALAGRALSAYNLMIFAGVFVVQWGIGLLIDAFKAAGLGEVASFQAAMGVYLCCAAASYAAFVRVKADNSSQ